MVTRTGIECRRPGSFFVSEAEVARANQIFLNSYKCFRFRLVLLFDAFVNQSVAIRSPWLGGFDITRNSVSFAERLKT